MHESKVLFFALSLYIYGEQNEKHTPEEKKYLCI